MGTGRGTGPGEEKCRAWPATLGGEDGEAGALLRGGAVAPALPPSLCSSLTPAPQLLSPEAVDIYPSQIIEE